jgi:uncharacterized protein
LNVCEWDPAKAESNIKEHNVDFADAAQVFDNPYLNVEDTDAVGEQRFNALGVDSQGRLLVVTYTYRQDKKRLISAHKANRKQGRQYAKRIRLQ